MTDPFAYSAPTDSPNPLAAAPADSINPLAAFTAMLVTSRVGIDPATGNIWQYKGAQGMVQIGTATINTQAPVISGSTVHGNTLNVATGNWSTGGTYTYQWYSGSNPVATTSSYTTTAGDVGNMITCVVTLTSAVGGPGSAPSNALGPIT